MEQITLIIEQAPVWLTAMAGVVTAANAITALTPTKIDDRAVAGLGSIVNALLRVLNVLSGNVLKNKNADDR